MIGKRMKIKKEREKFGGEEFVEVKGEWRRKNDAKKGLKT